jgi:hypothetical protein
VTRSAETTVLAPELAPGDVVLETGLAGISGRLTRVSVGPSVVDVTLADGSRASLARFEACRVQRAPLGPEGSAPEAPGLSDAEVQAWLLDAQLAETGS